MFGLLSASNQSRITNWTFFDFVDDFLAFFHQAFHGGAFHTLEFDVQRLPVVGQAFP